MFHYNIFGVISHTFVFEIPIFHPFEASINGIDAELHGESEFRGPRAPRERAEEQLQFLGKRPEGK